LRKIFLPKAHLGKPFGLCEKLRPRVFFMKAWVAQLDTQKIEHRPGYDRMMVGYVWKNLKQAFSIGTVDVMLQPMRFPPRAFSSQILAMGKQRLTASQEPAGRPVLEHHEARMEIGLRAVHVAPITCICEPHRFCIASFASRSATRFLPLRNRA
jgi:hypothetical protein